jgi:hypothetical protein
MAMACFLLVTFLPLRPDLSWPFFIAFISVSTLFPAAGEYFLPEPFFADDFFAAVLFRALAFLVEVLFLEELLFFALLDFFLVAFLIAIDFLPESGVQPIQVSCIVIVHQDHKANLMLNGTTLHNPSQSGQAYERIG